MAAIILPRVPSQLIRLALEDLALVENEKRHYTVDMSVWHDPHWKDSGALKVCAVCLAGSVMAKTLGAADDAPCWPYSFSENEDQLQAINELRIGCIESAFGVLGLEFDENGLLPNMDIVPYGHDPQKFREDMERLMMYLAEHGH